MDFSRQLLEEDLMGSSSKIPFQDLGRLHASVGPALREAFERALDQSLFIQGKPVQQFEREFASYLESAYVLGVANGTDALEMALEALGVGSGAAVVVPAMTFAATAEAVVRQGATPVLADVNPETFCLDIPHVEKAVAASPLPVKAVMLVHLYGRAADAVGLAAWCRKHGMALIEDCAQSHGACVSDGRVTGTVGDVGTFSFYPGKNLGALGDGGAVATQQESLAEKLKLLRDHGRTEKYRHTHIGRNSRLDALQAAFLSIKLRHLPQWTENRLQLARRYAQRFDQGASCLREQMRLLPVPAWVKGQKPSHVFHLMTVELRAGERRDALRAFLAERGIETGIHYPLALHEQPAYARFAHGPLPHSERASRSVLSLPMDPLMTEIEVDRVVESLEVFYGA